MKRINSGTGTFTMRQRIVTITAATLAAILPLSATQAASGTLTVTGGSASYNADFEESAFTTGSVRLAVTLRDTVADGACVTGKVTYHLNARTDRAVNLPTVCGSGRSFTSYPSYRACCAPVYLEGATVRACRVVNNWFDSCRSIYLDNPKR